MKTNETGASAGALKGKVRLLAGAAAVAMMAALSPQAALALPLPAYTAGSEAELQTAIAAANADGNPSATILLTGDFAITNPAAMAATKPVVMDMAGHTVTGAAGFTRSITLQNGGALQVTGAGSGALGSSLTIAGSTLRIENGGQQTFNSTGSITGTLGVSGAGSSLTFGGSLQAGQSAGVTTIQIDNGGVLRAGNASTLGMVDGSQVNLTVTGAGSLLTTSFALSLGKAGTSGQAAVTIADGGAWSATVGVNDGGATATGVSSILVTGTGSNLTSKAGMTLLRSHLSVQDGATVNLGLGGLNSTFGGPTSAATVDVSGAGSALNVGNRLQISNGAMTVTDGGAATAAALNLGSGGTGVLTISGAGSSVTATDAVAVGAAASSTGVVTLSDGGVLHAGSQIAIGGAAAGQNGVLNIGAAQGAAAAAAGSVDTPIVVFGNADGQLNFNHTDTDYVFGASISGPGAINHYAGVTHLTGDSSGFTGVTTVSGGELRVDGALGDATSSLNVASGGLLGGVGTLGGSAAIRAGGVVAPGNSIGALHVGGAFLQAAGSTYRAELDPNTSASDQIVVGGQATITPGANLQVVRAAAGNYRVGTVYTVLTANGGVSGTYALSGDLASGFLGLKDSYDASHVYLTVVQTRPLTDAAGTSNQEGVAGSLPSGSPVNDALLNLPSDAAAQHAFDQLSGESQAATKGVLVNDSRLVRDLATDRVRGMLCAPGTTDRALQQAKGCLDDHAQPTAWAQGFGAWGHSDSTANASGAQRSTGGFLIGADMPLAAIGRAGVFAGYSHTGVDVDSGVSDIDNYHAGVYGGLQRGPVGVRAGASFTYNAVDSTRQVAFDGFQDRLKGDYAAYTSQGYAEAGYELPTPGPVSVEGFANVAYASVHSQGFTEKGGPAALTATAQDTGVTYATLGVRPSIGMTLPGAEVALRGMVGWRLAFGDITPVSRVAFAGGTPFTVAGVPLARNSAVAEFGADLRLSSRAVLGVTYAGQYSARDVDQSVRAVLSVRF